ncbi:MAG: stage II sporulation protein P [Acetatifactor sp.]|nr:stage II sporulation protein P [Acetatifactor sp.]
MGPVKSRKKNRIVPVIVVCGCLLLVWQALMGGGSRGQKDGDGLVSRLLRMGQDQSIQELLPMLVQQEEQGDMTLQKDALEEWMPGYLYQTQAGQVAVRQPETTELPEQEENVLSLEELMQLENQEQLQEDNDDIRMLDLEGLMSENGWDAEEAPAIPIQENVELPEQNNMAAAGFVPHVRQQTVDLTALQDYETLRDRFYTVDSVTNIGRELLDVEKLTQRDLTIDKEAEGPHILLYHTHSQEGFADSIPGDDSTTIMGVGQHLADILEQQYGYQVLHHLGTYDKETRDNAYSRSLPEITQLLEEYPQIQVVIDLHRDAVADESTHLVMDLDGRPTARFMFFNGISWTRKTGSISYLQNDNLSDNLAFSFQMKLKAEEYYPGLTRRNYINGYRYNMHLRPRTLLIELGAQNNTLEEAMNACDPIAHLLDLVLSGEE